MTGTQVIFDPAFAWPVLAVLTSLSVLLLALAAWRGLAGWALRALAALALLAALSGPSLQREDREPLADILVAVVDDSASQRLSDRQAQTKDALAGIEAQAVARGLEMTVVHVGDDADNGGTRAVTALATALADLPRDRVAGVLMLTDGQIHDIGAGAGLPLPAPVHTVLSGHARDWDRRLVVQSAPAFAILGEEQIVHLRIGDMGAAPEENARTTVAISADGGPVAVHDVPVGVDLRLPVKLQHGGVNVIQITVPEAEGELTGRNNAAILQINGVRDRLRVLLVSGQPHPGTRTWRNLLKSDASVDLVHFTILRPPEKQDGVPVTELSLIAFPTQELFMDKVDEFDLIIFDRYKLRGILPGIYLQNVRDYVERGGAVLIAAGPDFASADSLARSALGDILPAAPTGRVQEDAYRPTVTELGLRHPVTRGLVETAPENGWGRWLREIELTATGGMTVMSGVDGEPLLILDRVGEGRVALLGSDQAWLWDRGFEGGGPQLELLRRLAHWMMKEPELEEEALTGVADGERLTVTRRTMESGGDRVARIEAPDGSVLNLPLAEIEPGVFQGEMDAPMLGLYRLSEGEVNAVVAVGPAAPREFETTIASDGPLEPLRVASGGGVWRMEDGVPGLRPVRPGRPASGRGWLGYVPRGAYVTADVSLVPLAPAWLMLLLASMLAVAAWLVEGRGRMARGT